MAPEIGPDAGLDTLRHIPLSYNNADSQASALRLVLTLFPDWEHTEGKVEFIRFKDGITNTVRKEVIRIGRPHRELWTLIRCADTACSCSKL